MRKAFKIGQKEYKFKKDAIAHYRTILNSYNFGESLNKVDFKDLIDLLMFGDENIVSSETELDDVITKETFVFDETHFSNVEINTVDVWESKFIKIQSGTTTFINPDDIEQLSREIQILKNQRYFCVTDCDFIFGDFIETFITSRNMKVKELTISTVAMTKNNVDSLARLLGYGYVDELNLIVSNHFFSYERDNLIKYIYATLDIDNRFQLSVCDNKSKIVLINSKNGLNYVIHGSANLSTSNSMEQFELVENEELFNFNKNFLDELIQTFKTINKLVKQLEINTDRANESLVLDGRASFNEFFEEELEIIDIKVSQVQFSTKCFEVFYSDDSSQYISYLMLINNTKYTPEKLFYVACRNSIHGDIRSVKQAYFDKNSIKGQVKCQETGILSTWTELAVDHRQPNTFSIIVDRFKEVNRVELETLEYTSNEQNHIIFKDENWTNNFRRYHMEKASLRIVRTECNSSRTGMARLKRTSKDLTINQNIS